MLENNDLYRRLFLNEVQIFIKGSKRRNYVCCTNLNKCMFLSSFTAEQTRRDGDIRVLISLMPMVFITTIALQFLQVLFVVEDTTPDLLTNLGAAHLRKAFRHYRCYCL